MTGIIKELFDAYKLDADLLGIDWKSMTKTQIANGYCDYDEMEKTPENIMTRDHYFSALMYKYSYMVTLLYSRRASVLMRLEIEEFHTWVVESLMTGLKYRRWRDPEYEALYNNPNGAEVVFNRCFFSTEKRYYKYYNQDCRKINYVSYSLDETFNCTSESGDDEELSLADTLIDPNSEHENAHDNCRDIVQYYINKGKVLEAIIVDGISYQNTTKEESYKTVEVVDDEEVEITHKHEYFYEKKLIKHLNNLDSVFMKYFKEHYNISNEALSSCIEKIDGMKNNKLYTIVDNAIEDMRNDENVLYMLGL